MQRRIYPSEFMEYLSSVPYSADGDRLPSLIELSKELGISVARLREQMEVARALGLVEVHPRTGMRRLPYTFLPAVRQSLFYGLTVDPTRFAQFSSLRNHLENAYWAEAVRSLTPQDHQHLRVLMERAWEKLRGHPIQIPHIEHRELHTSIYRRLDNPFVQGILDAYWEAYEEVGLAMYTDLDYLEQVWQYHQEMVDAICAGDVEAGQRAMLEHTNLLYTRTIKRTDSKAEKE